MRKIETKNGKIIIRDDGLWEGVGYIQGATTFTIIADDTEANRGLLASEAGRKMNFDEMIEFLDGAKFEEKPDFVR